MGREGQVGWMDNVFCSQGLAVQVRWNSQKYIAFKFSRSMWLKQSDRVLGKRGRKADASFTACLVLARSSLQGWMVCKQAAGSLWCKSLWAELCWESLIRGCGPLSFSESLPLINWEKDFFKGAFCHFFGGSGELWTVSLQWSQGKLFPIEKAGKQVQAFKF